MELVSKVKRGKPINPLILLNSVNSFSYFMNKMYEKRVIVK